MTPNVKAPFPYFGGKATIASLVWSRLGQPKHYIEPFFGSGAVLLARPDWQPGMIETANDKDALVANVWRALQYAPEEVARWCDWPVTHVDLNARRRVLLAAVDGLRNRLAEDDTAYDAKLAGYWIWAASCWIGSGLTRPNAMPHVSDGGMGVHSIGQIPHVSHGGKGVQEPYAPAIYAHFRRLAERLRCVRFVNGDWQQVCGGKWQTKTGICGMFFDPPYSVEAGRDNAIYTEESATVAYDVREWCLARGDDPLYRIALCGYDGEHTMPESWECVAWKTAGGYGNTSRKDNTRGQTNRHRERVWFSPHCLRSTKAGPLFEEPRQEDHQPAAV